MTSPDSFNLLEISCSPRKREERYVTKPWENLLFPESKRISHIRQDKITFPLRLGELKCVNPL